MVVKKMIDQAGCISGLLRPGAQGRQRSVAALPAPRPPATAAVRTRGRYWLAGCVPHSGISW
jgi:hypothetical protein